MLFRSLLTWLFFIFTTTFVLGWGLGLWWLISRLLREPKRIFLWGEIGFFGLFVLGVISTVLNFVSAIGSAAGLSTSIIGVILVLVIVLRHKEYLKTLNRQLLGLGLTLSFLLTAFVGLTRFATDAGLYHLPIQLWIRHEPVVFGLDRKSTRLNSSHSQQSRMPSSA